MPKINYLKSREEKQKDLLEKTTEKLCGDIRAAVFEILGRKYLTQTEFAKIAGLNQSTLSKRLKNPTDFEIGELIKIIVAFPEIREKLADSILNL